MGVLLSCEIVDKYQSINYFMGIGLLFLVARKSNFEYPLGNVLFLWDAFRDCPKITHSFQLPQHNYNYK